MKFRKNKCRSKIKAKSNSGTRLEIQIPTLMHWASDDIRKLAMELNNEIPLQ